MIRRVSHYRAPPDEERCISDRRPLADGTLARCMRPRAYGSLYCYQHRMLNRGARQPRSPKRRK